jgi:hypothetical protein
MGGKRQDPTGVIPRVWVAVAATVCRLQAASRFLIPASLTSANLEADVVLTHDTHKPGLAYGVVTQVPTEAGSV